MPIGNNSNPYYRVKYVEEIREIPIKTADSIYKVDQFDMNAGMTYEQSVVEFFKEPHTTGQLNKWLKRTNKLSQITNCYKTYIRPLLARGLIMQLYPFTENKGHMKYVAVGYDKTPIATEDAILEFCREPRTKRDIRIHFCLSHWQSAEYVRRLLADNKMTSDDDKPFSRPTKTFRAI